MERARFRRGVRWLLPGLGLLGVVAACAAPSGPAPATEPAVRVERAPAPDASAAVPQETPAFLWRVRSDTATVYLLGSIHVGRPDAYPLPDVIESAFAAADTLVVEAPLDPETSVAAARQLLAAAMYPPGESLSARLSPETSQLLRSHLATRGIDRSALERLRPWFVITALTVIEFERMGYAAQHGMDRYFESRAAGRKTVLALETVEEQLALLRELADDDEDLMLRQFLGDVDRLEEVVTRTWALWKRGDAESLDALLLQDLRRPEYAPVFQKLFLDRNARMKRAIDDYLGRRGTYFVVVGSGHLVGPGGLVDLLEADGRRVEQLSSAPSDASAPGLRSETRPE